MTPLLPYLLTAFVLGFTAGVTPGPISAMALAETLAGGWRRGIWVAVAPAFTDVPLVVVVWLVSVRLSPVVLTALSVLGAGFLLYLAFDTWRSNGVEPAARGSGRGTLGRAIMANLLNPNPYLFWTFVGVPLLGSAAAVAWLGAPAVFGAFMAALVATKIVLIALVDRGRNVLGSRGYRRTLRASAVLLAAMALATLVDGCERVMA